MTRTRKPAMRREQTPWTFLSNHAHVLICLAGDPEMRMRDVAERVGITERGVQKIVADLEEAGVLQRRREGRRNRYAVKPDVPLRHPVESHRKLADLLAAVLPGAQEGVSASVRKSIESAGLKMR